MVLGTNINGSNYAPFNTAFFSYLTKNEKEFIKALKYKKRRFNSRNWHGCFNNFKHFCMYNDLKTKKEITAFLDSPSMKEIFKNKARELKNIKKNVLRSFAK